MESTSSKMAEGLEKYGDEGVNVSSSFFGSANGLSKVCVRETNADTDYVRYI